MLNEMWANNFSRAMRKTIRRKHLRQVQLFHPKKSSEYVARELVARTAMIDRLKPRIVKLEIRFEGDEKKTLLIMSHSSDSTNKINDIFVYI